MIHTLDLAQQNRTPDPLVLARVNQDDRVLVTKDTDFEITRELGQGPPKLLLITTGNIHNNELLRLFVRHEETLFRLLARHEFIELSWNQVIVHR